MSEFDDITKRVSVEQTEQVDETKVESTETVEKTDEKVDTVEKTEEVEKTEDKVEKVDNPFSFDSFKSYAKENFEKDIESVDDLKAYFEKADKYSELDNAVREKEQRITELSTLASKGLMGRDWFVSDDEFIRQQFLKQKSGEFSETALSVLSDLSPEKVGKLDYLKAIETQMMVDNPDLDKDEVKALIEKEYGEVDVIEDMDVASRAKLKVDGNAARKSLGKLFEGIEVPKAVNFEEQITAKRDAWSTPVKDIVDGIDKLQLTEDFAFDIKAEDRDGLTDELLSYALATQADVTEDSASRLAAMARSQLLEKNLDKIMKAYGDDIREQEREALRKEIHNDKDLNNDKRPVRKDGEAMSGAEFLETL